MEAKWVHTLSLLTLNSSLLGQTQQKGEGIKAATCEKQSQSLPCWSALCFDLDNGWISTVPSIVNEWTQPCPKETQSSSQHTDSYSEYNTEC